MTLTLITGNPNKARETRHYTSLHLEHQAVELPEIQSLDVYEIVRLKAQAAYEQLQKPVLVEDTSVIFPHLGRLPGPFIKWFLEELKPEGLCRLLDADPERRALASVNYGLHDGKEIHIFSGSISGTVSQHPSDKEGFGKAFGWDVIFIPDGYSEPWSGFSEEDKLKTSIRRQALLKIEAWMAANT